jgi:hypothetical protein
MFTITHNDKSFDFGSLPLASQIKLASRGLAHMRGNEVVASVIGDFRREARKAWIAANSDDAWKALSDEAKVKIEKKGIPATDSDAYKRAVDVARVEFDNNLVAGTLSEGRTVGPRKSPLEIECGAIARRETIEILSKKNGDGRALFEATAKKRVPKDEDVFSLKGESVTFADLIERRFARFEERITKEAKKVIADREKAAAKAGNEDVGEAF